MSISNVDLAKCWPHPGATYEHYKGGRYVVIALAEHHETRARLVVYRPIDSEILSVRPLYGSKEDPDGWIIPASEGVPRFKAVVQLRPINEFVPHALEKSDCDHGVLFNAEAAAGLSSTEIRKRWPRLSGACPKGCGYSGVAYASYAHYISGDW